MALYYNLFDHHEENENRLWTDTVNGIAIMKRNARDVFSIRAYGYELEAIKTQFSNIPMGTGRQVVWYGETAKFIAANFEQEK